MDEGLGGALRAQGTGGEREGVRGGEREREKRALRKEEGALRSQDTGDRRGPERGHRQATERRKTSNAGGLGRGCAPGTPAMSGTHEGEACDGS